MLKFIWSACSFAVKICSLWEVERCSVVSTIAISHCFSSQIYCNETNFRCWNPYFKFVLEKYICRQKFAETNTCFMPDKPYAVVKIVFAPAHFQLCLMNLLSF